MALSPEEFKGRVVAAAALYGLNYGEVRKVLGDYGAVEGLSEAIVAGKKRQSDKHIRELAEAFALPKAWFTEPDWRLLIRDAPPKESELAVRAKERAARALGTGRSKSQGTPRATHPKPGDE